MSHPKINTEIRKNILRETKDLLKKLRIDIREDDLWEKGDILNILLIDRTTKKNIIWATDSYEVNGDEFAPEKHIRSELVTGIYGKLIQPRAAKSLIEQRRRTRGKAEVFTPLDIVDKMNKSVEDHHITKHNWQEYIRELKLEITCGEAPFIVSRYNPTAHGVLIKIENRVGFLDRKLRLVSRYCYTEHEWLFWAKEAFRASYGYDWQWDNVLIARENLLYTMIDYYEAKFSKLPSIKIQEEFAEIISWNIWQMDWLKYVIPMSCYNTDKIVPGVLSLFEEIPDRVEIHECEGCRRNNTIKHNGIYATVMDWNNNKVVRFVDIHR